MNRISSRATIVYKRIFPAAWFGLIAILACVFAVAIVIQQAWQLILVLVILVLIMGVVPYAMMKWLVFDLVDEVWDADAELVVKNSGREERIALADIAHVNYSMFVNPPRITLLVSRPCVHGDEVSFIPPLRFANFSMPPIARDLIARTDAARRQSQN